MDLLVELNLFTTYLNSILKVPRNEFENDITSLVNNINNRFVISKEYIDLLEKLNKDNPAAQVILETFVSNLINNNAFIVPSAELKEGNDILSDLEEGYQRVDSSNKNDVFLILTSSGANKDANSIDLNNITKPNKNWVIFKLCCHHPLSITLRHYDFKADKEIKSLMEALMNIHHRKQYVSIFDRQANLQHDFFNSFKNSSKVHYYTCYDTFRDFSQDLKDKFKSVKIFVGRKTDIHERKICKGKLILEVDEDFWNLKVDRPTWKFDITYCADVHKKISEKASKFQYKIIP